MYPVVLDLGVGCSLPVQLVHVVGVVVYDVDVRLVAQRAADGPRCPLCEGEQDA